MFETRLALDNNIACNSRQENTECNCHLEENRIDFFSVGAEEKPCRRWVWCESDLEFEIVIISRLFQNRLVHKLREETRRVIRRQVHVRNEFVLLVSFVRGVGLVRTVHVR